MKVRKTGYYEFKVEATLNMDIDQNYRVSMIRNKEVVAYEVVYDTNFLKFFEIVKLEKGDDVNCKMSKGKRIVQGNVMVLKWYHKVLNSVSNRELFYVDKWRWEDLMESPAFTLELY